MSKVILVGAGPGDVSLLTLKAKNLIEQADCIVYDRLISKDILNFAKENAELIYVGKENHKHVLKQDQINSLLFEKAKEHELVVRLKGGDPYVFGRGGEEILYLKAKGIEVEEVPGVTSAISVLSAAGIPITHRGLAKGFQVITAHSKNDELSEIDFSQLLDEDITLVFLMGLNHVKAIAEGLILAGRSKETKAAVISRGTTPMQRKCLGNLSNIAALVEEAKLESPAIIVVGRVVELSNELAFYERKPLFGKKIIVPYITGFTFDYSSGVKQFVESQLIGGLREKGAEVVGHNVGKIVLVEHKISREELNATDWLIFTSSAGVNSFMYNLKESGLDMRSMANTRIAVVGKQTAKALNNFSLMADYVSYGQTANALAQELGGIFTGEENVLYATAEQRTGDIELLLSNKCNLKAVPFYKNEEVPFSFSDDRADYICFTSASTVKRVTDNAKLNSDLKIVTIGKSTSKALIEHGYSDFIQSKETSYEGIIKAIIERL